MSGTAYSKELRDIPGGSTCSGWILCGRVFYSNSCLFFFPPKPKRLLFAAGCCYMCLYVVSCGIVWLAEPWLCVKSLISRWNRSCMSPSLAGNAYGFGAAQAGGRHAGEHFQPRQSSSGAGPMSLWSHELMVPYLAEHHMVRNRQVSVLVHILPQAGFAVWQLLSDGRMQWIHSCVIAQSSYSLWVTSWAVGDPVLPRSRHMAGAALLLIKESTKASTRSPCSLALRLI